MLSISVDCGKRVSILRVNIDPLGPIRNLIYVASFTQMPATRTLIGDLQNGIETDVRLDPKSEVVDCWCVRLNFNRVEIARRVQCGRKYVNEVVDRAGSTWTD